MRAPRLPLLLLALLTACDDEATVPSPPPAAPAAQPTAPTPAPPPPAPAAPPEVALTAADGATIWQAQSCLACHGEWGEGGVGPALAGRVPTLEAMVARIRAGAPPMPAWTAAELPDAEIAAVRAWLLTLPVPGPPAPSPDVLATREGVDVSLLVGGLDHPVALAQDPAGRVYVSTNGGVFPRPGQKVGAVWRIGAGGKPEPFIQGIERPLGLAWLDGRLIVSSRGRLSAWQDTDGDGLAEEVQVIRSDLPAAGLHQNNDVDVGPDGRLYVGMGTASNADVEGEQAWSGAVLAIEPETAAVEVYARGLRNPFGLAFAADGALYATDNGVDPKLVEAAPEEVNRITPGGFYGHPYIFGDQPRPDGPPPPSALGTPTAPLVMLTPHASANGIAAYDGAMFPDLRGRLLVAEFGSYISRFHRAGRRLIAVDPQSGAVEVWASGFLGRPLDVLVAQDGAVLVTDFEQGAVWRFFASDRQRTRFSPSFDCTKASSVVEHAICNDPQLAALDGQLSAAYAEARAVRDEAERLVLRDAQRAWLKRRDACASDPWPVVCVKDSMLQRLAELSAPQL